MSDESPNGRIGYRYAEQHIPPEPQRVSDVAITTHPHLFEVDPRLMERWVLQQEFPNWDSLRIMNSRGDHLAWMHRHFATTVVTGSELLAEVESEPAVVAQQPTDHSKQSGRGPLEEDR